MDYYNNNRYVLELAYLFPNEYFQVRDMGYSLINLMKSGGFT